MTPSPDAQLKLNIKKRFHARPQDFALEVEFAVGAEIVVLFGPSGAGKTTILECIAGLISPDAGRITLNSDVLFDNKAVQSMPVRQRRLGYVFQNLALFPHLTAGENVGYGLRESSRRGQAVTEMMETLRIAHVANRRPGEISGGEKQRVALARALVTKPKTLLLDEPMSALDFETKSGILADLRTWHSRHPVPLIYVTHSLDEVFAIGDRVIILKEGKVTGEGKPSLILTAERDRLVAALETAS